MGKGGSLERAGGSKYRRKKEMDKRAISMSEKNHKESDF